MHGWSKNEKSIQYQLFLVVVLAEYRGGVCRPEDLSIEPI